MISERAAMFETSKNCEPAITESSSQITLYKLHCILLHSQVDSRTLIPPPQGRNEEGEGTASRKLEI